MRARIQRNINYIANSLITRFVVIMLVLSIFPFLVLMEMIAKEITDMEDQRLYENFSDNLEIMSMNIDNCLSSVEALHAALLLDDSFLKNINNLGPADSSPPFADLKTARDIRSTLATTTARNNDLLNIYLYWPDTGRLLMSGHNSGSDYRYNDLSKTPWFSDYEKRTIPYSRWRLTQGIRSEGTILSSYRNLMSVIVSFNVSERTIAGLLYHSNPYRYADCFMIDTEGNLISPGTSDSGLQEYVWRSLVDNTLHGRENFRWHDRTYYLCTYQSAYSGITVVLYADAKDCISTSHGVHAIVKLYMIDALLLIVLSIVLVYTIFVKPMQLLSHVMRQSEHGNLSVRLPDNKKTEIGQIYHRFNQMSASINQLIEDNYISEIRKKNFEMKLLSSQINEHFLYNALDAIHWMARREHMTDVGEAVNSLAAFYRISLSYGYDKISVQNLVQMLDSYLKIQKLSLGDALHYEIDAPKELYPYTLPKYLFIPLVDNAIHHGIRGLDDGVVCISLKRHGSVLRFCVTDNGHGITSRRLEQIRTLLAGSNPADTDCFALKNLNTQLSLYFNNQEGVQIDTREGFGSSFWFDIPAELTGEKGVVPPCFK